MFQLQDVEVNTLVGKTVSNIVNDRNERLNFVCADGSEYEMLHIQDCCESVWLDDITGDLADLIDSVILDARCESNQEDKHNVDSTTWTFYRFTTNKGTVVLRWCGTSSGYYSESVDFVRVK